MSTVELLSFRKAAEEHRVSQPTITRAIQALEMELGGDLLVKRRSRMALSDLGRFVVPRIKVALRALDQVETSAKTFLRDEETSVHVAISEDARYLLTTATLEAFAAHAEAAGLVITTMTQADAYDAVADGAAQIGILVGDACGFALESRRIASLNLVIAASRSMVPADRVGLAELRDLPFIVDARKEFETRFDAMLAKDGIRRQVQCAVDDDGALLTLFKAGAGCVVLPEAQAVALGLRFVRIEPRLPPSSIVLVTSRRRRAAHLATMLETSGEVRRTLWR